MNRLLKRKDKKQESPNEIPTPQAQPCLLYTSDAADEL